MMKLKLRNFESEDDYWRIRAFLRDIFLLNNRRELTWHVARLDYWLCHLMKNKMAAVRELICLWETADGEIVAVMNTEEPGHVYLQVHPAFRSIELELEMIALAEEKFSIEFKGQQAVCLWADSQDELRHEALRGRGFAQGKWTEYQWRRDLDAELPEVVVHDGYVLRSLGDIDEVPARSWASWRGFHPNEPDEEYEGWEWYLNVQRCPLYRRDLDIVAVTSTDEIASFCSLWFDDVTRSAYIEPVATVPEHLRRGLARATITEGLRRLQKMGATRAFVGGYEESANALYASTLSPDHDLSQQWKKTWSA